MITVRYFAGAEEAAGVGEESLSWQPGGTVAELSDTLAQRHGDDLTRVLAAATFLVDEVAGGRERAVPDGATVDVLPPFAGG